MSKQAEKHVLGLSGGKDSAALAVFMKNNFPDLEIEYFFTDTGKELDEVYEFLGLLEGFIGPITRLNPEKASTIGSINIIIFAISADTLVHRDLKLRPFEAWIKPMLDSGVKFIPTSHQG